jgi:hypothetical protein
MPQLPTELTGAPPKQPAVGDPPVNETPTPEPMRDPAAPNPEVVPTPETPPPAATNPEQPNPKPSFNLGSITPTGTPSPTPTPTPKPPDSQGDGGEDDSSSDDLTSDYAAHRDELSQDAAVAEMRAAFSGGAKTMIAPKPAQTTTSGAKSPVGSAAMDVMHGVGEAPTAIKAGIRDAFQSTLNLADEVGDWVREKVPDWLGGGIVGDEHGVQVMGKKAYEEWKAKHGVTKDVPTLPEVNQPKSTTGGVIKGIAQFLTGFAAAGKAMGGLKAVGTAAKFAQGAAQGFAADFTAFDGHDKNLANLIKEHSELKNPVLDYLASDPKDTDAQGRLKNALIGLGAGVATEGVIQGFAKSLDYIKAGRATKATQDLIERVDGAPAKPAEVKPEDFHPIGDPEGDLFLKRTTEKVQEGMDATATRKPGDITGKPKGTPEVYINFAKIDTAKDVQTVIKKMAQMDKKAIDGEARGTRSWAATKLSAQDENAFNILMGRRTGEALNAEQSFAVRQLWATSADTLKKTAKLAKEAPTDANLFNFRKMLATHYAIQKEVIAARTETARALNSWKIPAGSSREMAMQMTAMLETTGGAKTAQDIARRIADLADAGNTHGIEAFVEGGAFMAKTRDAVQQIWLNGLLSNPATHVANTSSNFGTAFQQIYERKAAEYIRQKFGGGEGGVELGEAFASAHGMIEGFKDSLRLVGEKMKNEGVLKTVKDGLFSDEEGAIPSLLPKDEGAGHIGSLSSEKLGFASDTTMGRALDMVDVGTRVPGRLMGKADDFFKMIGYRMELNAQAVRRATQEMRSGQVAPDAFKARVKEIVDNPPHDIKLSAIDQATYQTFTGKAAEIPKGIADKIQSIPVLGKLLLPFKNTPINVMTYTFERTPLAPFIKQWRADIAAGGARADIAIARTSTGTMILSTMMDLALQGKITGKGPDSPSQRAEWERLHQPYSVKIGDKWVSINRLEPLGSTIGIAADLAEAILNAEKDISDHDFAKAIGATIFATSNNVLSKTYMQGTADFMGAVTNSQMKSEGYLKRLFGSSVPAAVAAVTRNGIPGVVEGDPYQRVAESYVDALRRRIPGLSKDLPLARNIWGEPRKYQSGMGWAYDMFSPAYMKSAKEEPIDKELADLQYYPDMPDHKMQLRDVMGQPVKLELNAKQYSRLVELNGKEWKHPAWGKGLKDTLNDLVTGNHPLSTLYTDRKAMDLHDGGDRAKNMLKTFFNEYHDGSRRQLLKENADLQARYDEKTKQRDARVPAKQIFGQ